MPKDYGVRLMFLFIEQSRVPRRYLDFETNTSNIITGFSVLHCTDEHDFQVFHILSCCSNDCAREAILHVSLRTHHQEMEKP